MRLLAAAVAAMVLSAAAPAYAQDPTPAQYEALMRWATDYQTIVAGVTNPLAQLPPMEDLTEAGRQQWLGQSQQWAAMYRLALAEARAAEARLGPVPEAGDAARIYSGQEYRLGLMLQSMERFLDQYEAGITAVERNDATAIRDAGVNLVDAQMLVGLHFPRSQCDTGGIVGRQPPTTAPFDVVRIFL